MRKNGSEDDVLDEDPPETDDLPEDLDEEELEDLDEEELVDIDEDDDTDVEDIIDDEDGEDDSAAVALKLRDDDDEDDDDEEDEDSDDVEASLDVILKERLVVIDDDDEDEEDEEVGDADERGDSPLRVLPKQPGEFVCQSCFLVKHPSQLADADAQLCRDCV